MQDFAQSADMVEAFDSPAALTNVQLNACGKLTSKQREALRLSLVRKSSKEIARELGISARAVDQRLDAARIILEAKNRFEAGRVFRTYLRGSEGFTSDPFLLGRSGQERRGEGCEPSLYVLGEALHFSAEAAWDRGMENNSATWRRFAPKLPSTTSSVSDRIIWIVIGAVAFLTLALVGLSAWDSLKERLAGN